MLLPVVGCDFRSAPVLESNPLFSEVLSEHSGIEFRNFVVDTIPLPSNADLLEANLAWGINDDFMNQYAGAGIAIGDINNDGLLDIYFGSNQKLGALYLNKGNFQFEDITSKSGIEYSKSWVTGTNMADVNGDGLLDLYICRYGKLPMKNTRNLLFINNGDLTFTERSSALGLDDYGLSSSVSFFDMDLDGDLDAYVLNQPIFDEVDPTSFQFEELLPRDTLSSDRLYENVNGKFIDVSRKHGLPTEKGPGLGLVVSDINMDGWPDIYVANDWITNDFIYINQGEGEFKDECENLLSKNSFFSMGCDIADMDNNGYPDIFVCDMAPNTHYRRNMILNAAPQEYYRLQKKYKNITQYSRNMFFSNSNGHFKELGNQYGIARTDWSWSPLIADFDNDGLKDLFVTNGAKRDIGNMDFEMLMYTDIDEKSYVRSREQLVQSYPSFSIPNQMFRNKGQSRMEMVSSLWGIGNPLNTQTACYADLDNDGNLDLILNPTDSVAKIFKNLGHGNNHLTIQVIGSKKNTAGLGTKAWVHHKGTIQYAELTNARGFRSSSQQKIHFGLNNISEIDSLVLVFPSGGRHVIHKPIINQLLTVHEDSIANQPLGKKEIVEQQQFRNQTNRINPAFTHASAEFFEFARDKTAFRMFNDNGPAVAVGDLNQDGRDDFFIGGREGQASRTYFQSEDGFFYSLSQEYLVRDSAFADTDAIIQDLNNDGLPDIYVGSGGSLHSPKDSLYRDRIYLNSGDGTVTRCSTCIDDIRTSTSSVVAIDIEKDGIPELFVGGRVVPGLEGSSPDSYVLKIIDGTYSSTGNQVISELPEIGMVTDAKWADLNADGKSELIVTREWESVMVLQTKDGKLEYTSKFKGIPEEKGLWQSVNCLDLDRDGDLDILLGNWGLNSILSAKQNQPLTLLVNDFDNDQKPEPILCIYLNDTLDTFLGRNAICQAMPMYWSKYNTYQRFATTPLQEKFGSDKFRSAQKLIAEELRSVMLINDGEGVFKQKHLPFNAQSAPMITSCISPINDELIVSGGTNGFHYTEGSIDAMGLLRLGLVDDKDSVSTSHMYGVDESTQYIQARHLENITVDGRNMILVAQTGGRLLLVEPSMHEAKAPSH